MENACGQNCRRVAFLNDFHHVIQIAGSAAGYHRHRDGISNAPRQIHVITGLGAVAVYAVQNDLSRAKFHRALSPLDSIQPGIFAASLDKDFPAFGTGALSVNRNHDTLRTEFLRSLTDQVGIGDCRGIDAGLVRASLEQFPHIFHRANASAHSQGHETAFRHPADYIHHRRAAVSAGCDVIKNHLIRTLSVITDGHLYRIAHILQLTGLRLAKLDPACHIARVHIQTRNNSDG